MSTSNLKTLASKVKILFFDIETKPVKFWAWRTGKQFLGHKQIVEGEKFDIICICYKWFHEKQVHALDWGIRKQDSRKMIEEFSKVIAEADVVIGQNSDSFDVKQVNTQALVHGLSPIAWPTSEDTRKQIRKHFYVTSSSLQYMSQLLTGSGKDRMEFADWIDIVERKDSKALAKMIKYCKKDVKKTQEVWEKILPYVEVKVHKGIAAGGNRMDCPACGSKDTVRNGTVARKIGRYQRYQCNSCRHIFRDTRKIPE